MPALLRLALLGPRAWDIVQRHAETAVYLSQRKRWVLEHLLWLAKVIWRTPGGKATVLNVCLGFLGAIAAATPLCAACKHARVYARLRRVCYLFCACDLVAHAFLRRPLAAPFILARFSFSSERFGWETWEDTPTWCILVLLSVSGSTLWLQYSL